MVPSGDRPAGTRFGDRLADLVARRESQIVLGLDPVPERLWPRALESVTAGEPAQRAAAAVAAHCRAVVDAVGEAVVGVKLQVASFERLGAAGWVALHEVAGHARGAGLLVIADAKRGDIDVSALAYAQAFLGETPTPFGAVEGLAADALTVNPYLGADALAPLAETAAGRGAGLFVLVRTSNPGAADIQDLDTGSGPVWERVAALVDTLDLNAVFGATAPQHLQRARELMPRAVFLLPGVGAQGGRVEDLAPAFAPGRWGGLVAASRAIVDAAGADGSDPAAAALAAAERLRALAWELA